MHNPQVSASELSQLVILYASQMGNSKSLARQLQQVFLNNQLDT